MIYYALINLGFMLILAMFNFIYKMYACLNSLTLNISV